MSNLTDEQLLAVEKKGTNIIVSAGAGSGKTTVLKKRVERILLSGVNINNLIILTFTNNAAQEMKERIRKIIDENPLLKDQSELLDSAYITTFDSFASSLVKKYNYLLDIDKNFSIVDDSVINLEIDRIIDEIFEELYKSKDELFIKLVGDLEVKNDLRIRGCIKIFYKNLTNIIDRNTFLDNYVLEYYSDSFIESSFNEYENIVFSIRDQLLDILDSLKEETLKDDVIKELNLLYENLSLTTNYDELFSIKDFKIPTAYPGRYTDEGKDIKSKADEIKKELVKYLEEDKKTLIKHYMDTKDYATIIVYILKELDKRLNKLKKDHNIYQFYDIAFLAIDLVKNYEDVRNEIKNNTYEIMIDEYQDTNDIQETFISYIENNNVYTVGDIKQSIYRFRNANPYIFKKRYDEFSKGSNGFKIDLNKNFRSREEVIDDINNIFDNIMFDGVGGADYKNQHEMIYGNKEYLKHNNNESYKTLILEYDTDSTTYKDSEAEAFIIADDILNRFKNKEQVTYIDNNEMKSREVTYSDFCILVDKSRNFELLKKVLEYKGIPTTIYKDININDEDEIYILKNLITLVLCIKENRFDNEFKHAFTSIARSYLSSISDNELFNIISNESYKETDIYKKAYEISKKVSALSNREILNLIVDKFEVINSLNLVGDIKERMTKLEFFLNNVESLNSIGMDIYQVKDYFDTLLSSDELIKMSTNKDASYNTVKIMTIHGSKGLEYPYVYLPFLNSDMKREINNTRFKFSNKFGFVIPFYENGIGNTFFYNLRKYDEDKQAVSEKIRLFYVALTRAKEKLILINKFNKKIQPLNSIEEENIINASTISDILTLIKYKINNYIKVINLDTIGITDEYNLVKLSNYKDKIKKTDEVIKVNNLVINATLVNNKHFSKALKTIVNRDLKSKLDFGTFMHYVFEVYDFKNDNLDSMLIDDIYKEKVRNFLKHPEVKDIKYGKCYKEHEVRFFKDGSIFHGFIDLLVEYSDHCDIIDYKLSNINADEYVIQLTGYKNYIENRYNKPTNIYLYSINKDVFKKLN